MRRRRPYNARGLEIFAGLVLELFSVCCCWPEILIFRSCCSWDLDIIYFPKFCPFLHSCCNDLLSHFLQGLAKEAAKSDGWKGVFCLGIHGSRIQIHHHVSDWRCRRRGVGDSSRRRMGLKKMQSNGCSVENRNDS
ncbi:hypothetical protein SAY87_014385 [Trapa incisa]|uniref:Uncharacterized protein n=1 Tax=Trapa incisa TaxID=236973 RepID=A0AAN7GSJ5_9MYRT|nr:hypothetical protein SAY87_014385 [Trapa incisa]